MRSHLLEGKVRHHRRRPFTYQFEHDVYYWALDLDELDEVDASIRLMSRNRPNVVMLRDRDHLIPPAADIDLAMRQHLRDAGEEPGGWRITLVTNLRVFGYVFDPASFYLCRDPAGMLRVVVIEVHNTHGQRHLYTLRPKRHGTSHMASMTKGFYVSPFIDIVGRYAVMIRDEPDALRITIDEAEDGQPLLSTSVTLQRLRLTDRTLARMLVRHPFITWRTIGLIHWHGLRLWSRGAPVHHHGDATR